MSREIKFEFWDTDFNEMIPADELTAIGIGNALTDKKRYIPRQYTGLKDKHETNIYEGDIIEFNDCSYDRTGGNRGDQILRGPVVYTGAAFWCEGILLIDVECNDEELEIIGNIYENKELLEESTT
ncbi:YopX family protein [Geomicrobium sediminis]|uniref:Phage protein (TIGR01671 family) n=1 Tax=Geomicrobium sediminis TaxID=1347788 RepID=A0ABS2PG23_9BACL|nr:YopX family protein [Geomicrobium sediminis]MBM7634051.1 putative phage protein (TIGR01671 family) [Geomicrobium sediminis]